MFFVKKIRKNFNQPVFFWFLWKKWLYWNYLFFDLWILFTWFNEFENIPLKNKLLSICIFPHSRFSHGKMFFFSWSFFSHIVSGILKVPPGFRSQTHERENDLHQTAEEETSSLGLSGLPQTQNTLRRRSSHIFFIYMFFKQSLSILNADYWQNETWTSPKERKMKMSDTSVRRYLLTSVWRQYVT